MRQNSPHSTKDWVLAYATMAFERDLRLTDINDDAIRIALGQTILAEDRAL